jgi:hypothetical protein
MVEGPVDVWVGARSSACAKRQWWRCDVAAACRRRAGATEQPPGRARGSLAHQAALRPSLHGLPKRRRRRPEHHGSASSARSLGVVAQEGPDAGRAVVALSASSVSVRRPVRASTVHACLSMRPVSSVRCGRPSVRASGVQCPVSGVRAFPPASAVSNRSELVERGGGQAAAQPAKPRLGALLSSDDCGSSVGRRGGGHPVYGDEWRRLVVGGSVGRVLVGRVACGRASREAKDVRPEGMPNQDQTMPSRAGERLRASKWRPTAVRSCVFPARLGP